MPEFLENELKCDQCNECIINENTYSYDGLELCIICYDDFMNEDFRDKF